ncbi:SsrA-binding protein SmpB [Bacteroidales bacterium OttesenSCG-928-I21]|nr:SsrA-binding protein SmpB [Bacteroidales bacterium OttesenSCG-928-I21]
MSSKQITYKNKKAAYKFEFLEKYVAGIVLTGTEIKSIREGKINFSDSYCIYQNNELWITGLHISEYVLGTIYNHEPKRDRKLLLTTRELRRLQKKVSEKGLTIIPIELIINEKGLVKVEIALAKGKRLHDKREDIKTRDNKREIERRMRI